MSLPTPADLQSFGFVWLDKAKVGLALPTKVELRHDAVKALLHIHVRYSVRGRQCVIEISPSPVGPGTWARLEGSGVKRALTGYAPGTWWVKVATTLAHERSDWVGPFAVIVK